MKELLKQINENSLITIFGKTYSTIGETLYVTKNAPNEAYAKIVLENHFVLVISPEDNIAYFGLNHGKINEFDEYPETVQFEGKEFVKQNHDFQYVKQTIFGNPEHLEGDVEFWDYECPNSDNIISIAIDKDNNRMDIVAKYITKEDIYVK